MQQVVFQIRYLKQWPYQYTTRNAYISLTYHLGLESQMALQDTCKSINDHACYLWVFLKH